MARGRGSKVRRLILASLLLSASLVIDGGDLESSSVARVTAAATKHRTYSWYAGVLAPAMGADILTTGIALYRGREEQNPLLPTVEIRIGAKVLACSGIAGLAWILDHYEHPRLAKLLVFVADGVFLALSIHNLVIGPPPGH